MKVSILLGVLAWAAATLAAQKPDCSIVPGWEQTGPARMYTADNLFDYMNGNAEGYVIYSFLKMDGVTCKSGENTFVFDVSEIGSPELAYGIYTANRDIRRPAEKIGMAGQIQPRRAIFAKGKYFVEIAASPDKDHTASLRAFVEAMEKRIQGTTELPAALGWFPAEKLVKDSVRLVPQSVLGMRALRRGYVAEYEFGKAFIATESSPDAAAASIEKVKARVGEGQAVAIADGGFQVSSRYLGRVCMFRKGNYLAGYANLAEGADGAALAKALAERLP
jgi:hypothetical protein